MVNILPPNNWMPSGAEYTLVNQHEQAQAADRAANPQPDMVCKLLNHAHHHITQESPTLVFRFPSTASEQQMLDWATSRGLDVEATYKDGSTSMKHAQLKNADRLLEVQHQTPAQVAANCKAISQSGMAESAQYDLGQKDIALIANPLVPPISAFNHDFKVEVAFPEKTSSGDMRAWAEHYGIRLMPYIGQPKLSDNPPIADHRSDIYIKHSFHYALINESLEESARIMEALKAAGIPAEKLYGFHPEDVAAITGQVDAKPKSLLSAILPFGRVCAPLAAGHEFPARPTPHLREW